VAVAVAICVGIDLGVCGRRLIPWQRKAFGCHAFERTLRKRCVLITTNSALSGARRADVTGFGAPEHYGNVAISSSTSG